ncbi:FAD-dependent monooxygenase [Saccharopolyspora erythraea]|uniref:FAD-dependent monooxygenase n=1 Tax=Saccharopolyspora erythraea TaxID=1836 RepID=UPI001BAB30FE|nr:FAD-dependent monooxygenase [Saccharopolyspora erythraea]QUH04409.1 FAD-dependent monooxygenase [Saccharopolyspora erythraea]
MLNVLISGAGVAGPALAYWLRHHGFGATVVERAPAIRTGGQPIDVRGTALDVVERMGLLDEIRRHATDMTGMSYVDPSGAELWRDTGRTLTGGDLACPDVELMRSDLVRIMHAATRHDSEYVLGDSITSITQREHDVLVTFDHGAPRTFDLVVGADGLHSAVRGLVFGDESRFAHHLDTYLAIFSVPNFLGLDRWQVFHQSPGKLAGVLSTRRNTEVRAMLGFEAPRLDFDHRDVEGQKRLMAERFGADGWEVPRLLEEMWRAPDFFCDSMSQIRMPGWSSGRVALAGDAGYCASPLSGMGTSLALVAGYVLAGELAAADGDHTSAFAAYEREMRDYVRGCQELAITNGRGQEDQGPLNRAARSVALKPYSVQPA